MTSIKEQYEAHMRMELEHLLEWAGSPSTLANILEVPTQMVTNWRARGRISATCAEKIELLTQGQFTKRHLRPDVNEWYSDMISKGDAL
jgi:DNA-binding transcriptional regulator YdaS (Cro superfamily)